MSKSYVSGALCLDIGKILKGPKLTRSMSMRTSSECRKCGEPLWYNRQTQGYDCPRCDCAEPEDFIDKVQHTMDITDSSFFYTNMFGDYTFEVQTNEFCFEGTGNTYANTVELTGTFRWDAQTQTWEPTDEVPEWKAVVKDAQDADAEASYEESMSDYYGGSGPMTAREQQNAAVRFK